MKTKEVIKWIEQRNLEPYDSMLSKRFRDDFGSGSKIVFGYAANTPKERIGVLPNKAEFYVNEELTLTVINRIIEDND